MLARLGDVIYWFACIVAAIILAVGVFDYWFGQGGLLVLISWMALAAIPWLIGSAIRYILSGK
jgi:O-antigen ligase